MHIATIGSVSYGPTDCAREISNAAPIIHIIRDMRGELVPELFEPFERLNNYEYPQHSQPTSLEVPVVQDHFLADLQPNDSRQHPHSLQQFPIVSMLEDSFAGPQTGALDPEIAHISESMDANVHAFRESSAFPFSFHADLTSCNEPQTVSSSEEQANSYPKYITEMATFLTSNDPRVSVNPSLSMQSNSRVSDSHHGLASFYDFWDVILSYWFPESQGYSIKQDWTIPYTSPPSSLPSIISEEPSPSMPTAEYARMMQDYDEMTTISLAIFHRSQPNDPLVVLSLSHPRNLPNLHFRDAASHQITSTQFDLIAPSSPYRHILAIAAMGTSFMAVRRETRLSSREADSGILNVIDVSQNETNTDTTGDMDRNIWLPSTLERRGSSSLVRGRRSSHILSSTPQSTVPEVEMRCDWILNAADEVGYQVLRRLVLGVKQRRNGLVTLRGSRRRLRASQHGAIRSRNTS